MNDQISPLIVIIAACDAVTNSPLTNFLDFWLIGQIDGQEVTAAAVHMPRPARVPPRRSPPRRPPPRWRNSPPRFRGGR